MTNRFDQFTKSIAQSVTRRGALRQFGVGIAGVALACLGLGNKARADKTPPPIPCQSNADCRGHFPYTCCRAGACAPWTACIRFP